MTLPLLANDPASAVAPRTRSWMVEVWRLSVWNLALAWRRVLAKVLLGLLLGAYALVVGVELLIYASQATGGTPSSNDASQATRDLFTFPTSLMTSASMARYLGPLLVCIMIGAVIGGEYGFGTHRLSLSRGMTRAQVLGAQVLMCLMIALALAAGLLLIGTLIGDTVGPALGSDLLLPDLAGAGELVLYWLALALNLFGYMLIAVFFATLGRSSVAGIGGAVGLMFVELVLNSFLVIYEGMLAVSHQEAAAARLVRLSAWLPGNSFGYVIAYAGRAPIHLESDPNAGAATGLFGAAPISPAQALLVALGYCVVLIGASYALFRLRDVTD